MGAGQVGAAAAVTRGWFNGAGDQGGGRSLQKKQTPESLRYTILTKGGSLVLNKEGFQKNEQTL